MSEATPSSRSKVTELTRGVVFYVPTDAVVVALAVVPFLTLAFQKIVAAEFQVDLAASFGPG